MTTARAITSTSTTLADWVSLTKPRLSSLVLCTTAGGLWLAPQGLSLGGLLLTLFGTAGAVGAANALNCYIERDSDRFMKRTRRRPLPSGRMEPSSALIFGLVLSVLSVVALYVGANPLTALLGALALVSYVCVYTPLKSRSASAMFVGVLPGALPPLMGWTAATGRLEAGGVALFALLAAWQVPHFIAISLFRQEEYEAAGLKSLPAAVGEGASRWVILLSLLVLMPVSVLPTVLGLAGPAYLAVALALGGAFFGYGLFGVLERGDKLWARRLFFLSLIHLTGVFAALMLDGQGHG